MKIAKIIAPVAGILLLASPVFAQSTADINAQIATLLAQIKALQAQIAQLEGRPATSASACVNLSYNLYSDQSDSTTNGEVTKLQQFLAQDSSIYPAGLITGYFGPMTEAAVQRWQARNGIVSSGSADTTGYGYVGPRTRAAMSCGGSTSANANTITNPLTTYTLQRDSLVVRVFDTWTTTGGAATFSNVTKDTAPQLCAIASNDATCVWSGQIVRPTLYLVGSFRASLYPIGNPLQEGLQHHIEVADTQQDAQYRLFAIHEDLLGRVTGIHELETREEVSTKAGVRVFAWDLKERVTAANGTVSIQDLPEGTYKLKAVNVTNGTVSLPSEQFRTKSPAKSRSSTGFSYAANTPLVNGYWSGNGVYFFGGASDEDTLTLVGTMAMYDIFRGVDFPARGEINTVVFVQEAGSVVIIANNVEKIKFKDVSLTIDELLQLLASRNGGIYRTEKYYDAPDSQPALRATPTPLTTDITTNATAQPLSCELSSSKAVVSVHEAFTLTWKSNADYGTPQFATAGDDYVGPNGSITLNVGTAGERTYTITFSGKGKQTTCSTKVTVIGGSTPGTLQISAGTQPTNSLAMQGTQVPFASFTLTNNTNRLASIKNMTIRLGDASSSQVFSSLRVQDDRGVGWTGGSGVGTVFSSNGQALIGTGFTLASGETRTYTILGGMANNLSAYAGQTVTLSLIGLGTDFVVSGTLPIVGATHQVSSPLTYSAPPTIAIVSSVVSISPAMSMGVQYDNMPAASVRIVNSSGAIVWTQNLTAGGGGSTVVSLSSVLPTGYYTAQAVGSNGTIYATSAPYYFMPAPTCTLSATNPYDYSTGNQIPVTLSWTSQNATSASGSGQYIHGTQPLVSLGSVGLSGSMTVNPNDSINYTFTFTGAGGSKACTAQVALKG